MTLRQVNAVAMPAFDGYEKGGAASREPGDCLFDVEVPLVQKTDSASPDVAFEACAAVVISPLRQA